MKRSNNFLLREVAGSTVAVPLGSAAQAFPGMLRLNATGCYLWELLQQEQTEESLTEALVSRYEVTRQQAAEDVKKFLEPMRTIGAVE